MKMKTAILSFIENETTEGNKAVRIGLISQVFGRNVHPSLRQLEKDKSIIRHSVPRNRMASYEITAAGRAFLAWQRELYEANW